MSNLDRFTKGIARALARAKIQSKNKVLVGKSVSAEPVIVANNIDSQDDPIIHSDEQYRQTTIKKMIIHIKSKGTK
ncbi:hypothetical protein J1G35_14940 [Pseudomonas sp. SH10-3B]|uniref:hypothetical protein n=1 Tax=Pseudomonas sp. SH10-3B TaxID=2816049 RepID=UPI001CA71415|nr:hypothetical protein [Pseudomonas sp. SH10-3B]MBY8947158.1 hypothetical protein [Pseudomonas sp. SH10-3B]